MPPGLSAKPVAPRPGVGARGHIAYYNGRRLQRDFVAWRDGAGYDIVRSDANDAVADVSWRLNATEVGASLGITITPTMFGIRPGPPRRLQMRAVVLPMLRRYLRAALDGIEWCLTAGETVRRDQLGSHPWFSGRAR